MYSYFYQVFMILSLVTSLVVIVLTWRRRHLPAAPAMIALAAATFLWTLGFLLESHSETLERQVFFNNIGYLGSMSVPVAWFVFANNYTNTLKFIRGWRMVLVCIIPLFITVLIWTNNMHHLMWSNEHLAASGPFTVTAKTYGPLFWVALVHNYLLVASGGVILLRRLFTGNPLYTKQAVSLIIAVILPWMWNIIYVFDLASLPRKDLTPVMFAVSGAALTLGLTRFHMFTTIPFARNFVIRQLLDGIFVFDVRDCLVEANPAALKIAGLDNRAIGKKLEELVSLSPLFIHMTTDLVRYRELALIVDGEKRLFELEIVTMEDPQAQPVGWLVVLRDITERRKAEEQHRLVAEYSGDIIYKLNIAEERYTYVSPSVEHVLGYTEKEALSLKPVDVLTPESYEKQRAHLLADMQSGVLTAILQLNAVHKDGHIIPIEVHGNFVCDENGIPVEIVGIARDISERKKMEEQLIMQDRLASIGQLTSGVAHEMNNPLTSIINFSTLLLKRELPEDVLQDVRAIYEEAQRTAYIVKNLLTFARKQAQEKEPINIIECIEKVQELRSYEQKVNNIQTRIHASPELPLVMGNRSQLQQVFFNIIINAEYFMLEARKKGTLDISAGQSGKNVRVSITDDGPGISREDLKYIFSPFFTTKSMGKGTGLSLSICLGIITEHGGRIWAESEKGKGATFIVELPVYREPSGHGAD